MGTNPSSGSEADVNARNLKFLFQHKVIALQQHRSNKPAKNNLQVIISKNKTHT